MSGHCTKMRKGRFQQIETSRPAMLLSRSRKASSICFCVRARLALSTSWISIHAELRRTLLDRRFTSGNSFSAASTCSALETV